MWGIRMFCYKKKEIELPLGALSKDSSKELSCSTMPLCHKNDISLESNTVALPWWLSDKESTANAGYMHLIPGPGRSHVSWSN